MWALEESLAIWHLMPLTQIKGHLACLVVKYFSFCIFNEFKSNIIDNISFYFSFLILIFIAFVDNGLEMAYGGGYFSYQHHIFLLSGFLCFVQ